MMKHRKIIVYVLLAALLIGYIPALATPVSAEGSPVLVLGANTAVNPILDHKLDYETYKSGGPFTVTFEWKAFTIFDNDQMDPGAAHAFVGVTGTVYGTTDSQAATGLTIKGHTDWQTSSFNFQNVGTYPAAGANLPGNILRFGMWKASGELQIRNLVIKDASGAVKYDLNTDPVVGKAVSDMQSAGITERDLSVLLDIDNVNCPWAAGQFGAGSYYAFLRCELPQGGTTTTTTPTTLSTTIPSSAPSPSTGLVGVPTYANIATNKEAYDVNEDVMFSFQTDGDTNTLHVSRVDGQWENTYTGLGDSYKLSFGWAGEYRALVEAVSSRGYYLSEPVYFTIGAEPVAPTTVPTTNTTRPTTFPTTAPGTPTTTTVRCPDGHYFKKGYCINCQTPAAVVVEIRTDKSVYNQGDKIAFIVTGDGYNSVTILYPDGTALTHPGVFSNYTIIAEQIGQYTVELRTGIGNDVYYSELYSFTVIAGPTTEPTTPTNPNECPDGHTYLKGVCYYCGAKDPCHDCTYNGHNFSQGVCIFCDTPDPSVTKPTTRPTTAPTTATTAAPTIKPTTTVPTTKPTTAPTAAPPSYITTTMTTAPSTASTSPATSIPHVIVKYLYTSYSDEGIYITHYSGGDGENVVIPSEIDGHRVIGIDREAFTYPTLMKSVTIPDGVKEIRLCAFENCEDLKTIYLPASVTTIGDYAFNGCDSLTNVFYYGTKYSKSQMSIGSGNTKLQNATWNYADPNENDYDYTVTDGEAIITQYLGEGGHVVIPSTLGGCPVIAIGENAFIGCHTLTSVTISDSVIAIGKYAFWNCHYLNSITFGNRVATIDTSAFSTCHSLVTVSIPANVTYIDGDAFAHCRSLLSIEVAIDNPVYASEDGVLFNKDKSALVLYPGGKAGAYSIPDSVTTICEGAFWLCESLTLLTMGDNVITIGDSAFMYCASLRSVIIGGNVTSIGEDAFRGCKSLTTVTVPASVLVIDEWAFGECGSLTAIDVALGNSVYSSENGVLFTKDKSTLIQCPAGKFGNYVVPACVSTIGDGAFVGCKFLLSVTIPNDVTIIDDYAFFHCESLLSLTIHDDVLQIGDYAFKYCKSLIDVYYSGSELDREEMLVGEQNSCLMDATWHYNCNFAAITTQPKDASAATGATAKVTVSATGDGLTYQWYFKNAGASKFSLTTSFTGNTYFVKMDESRNGRQIYCVITDRYGNSVTTDTVTLSMKTELKITGQPTDVCVNNGETAAVTVTAEGEGLIYKWYYKDAGASDYKYTASFKGNTYSVTMTDARAGRRVLCKVYDKYGNMVKSSSALLSQAVRITKQPANVCVANGKTATVKVTAIGDGLTYRWYYKNAGDTKYTYTSSFTGDTYSVTMTDARAGRRVLCKVYDKYGNMVQSKSVVLSQSVRIAKQSATATVSNGATAKITVTAVGEGLTYKWYYKNAGATKFSRTTSFTGNTYSVKMDGSRNGRQVYCVIIDQYGNSVKSKTVTLKMK